MLQSTHLAGRLLHIQTDVGNPDLDKTQVDAQPCLGDALGLFSCIGYVSQLPTAFAYFPYGWCYQSFPFFFPYGRVTLMRIVFLLKSVIALARLALLQSVSTLVRLALLQSVPTLVRRVLLQSVPPHGSIFIHFH